MKPLCKNCIHYYRSNKGYHTCQNRYKDILFINPNNSCLLYIQNIDLLVHWREKGKIKKLNIGDDWFRY